jgi:hypothetical protein
MPDSRPKTVQIFLPDGNARSVRIAAVTSRTVQAVQIPRSKLKAAAARDEVQRVGVYVLFGDTEDGGKPAAYIGEAENCYDRLQQHHRRTDFWKTAVAITSKTMSFTKAHARYLEYDCLRKAQAADRFRLENRAIPTEPHIPEPMRAELRDNFGTVQTLLSMLGVPILDPLTTSADEHRLLRCTGRGAEATGAYTEDGLVVFAGSTASANIVPSARDALLHRRERLVNDGVLVQDSDAGALVFAEDHPFNSPSGAAMMVLGRSANGWREWADREGRTLDDLERR